MIALYVLENNVYLAIVGWIVVPLIVGIEVLKSLTIIVDLPIFPYSSFHVF